MGEQGGTASLQCVTARYAALLTAVGALTLGAGAHGGEKDMSLSSLQRRAILGRFDVDQDGALVGGEIAALRNAFGGIDVPMLPDQAYDYASLAIPAVARSEFNRADNTPVANPLTNAGAALGRVLFYDTQLSRNRTVSCASCHHQRTGFSDPRRTSVGFEGGHTTRNAMGLANLRFSNVKGSQPGLFWDERAASLELQALMPIQDKLEMGMDLPLVVGRLASLPYYAPLFEAAFGSRHVSGERISKALAQFMRSLVSLGSRFDQAAASAADVDFVASFAAFTEQENLGKQIFINGVGGSAEFGCAHCHVPPTFAMPKAFNNGLEMDYKDRGLGGRDAKSNDPFTPTNDGKFKAPSLRNIELTAPYMHDGRFQTLEEVVEHYSSGVYAHANLGLAFETEADARGRMGFRYTAAQKAALIAFLKTLTDKEFVADPRFSDPFVRVASADDSANDAQAAADAYRQLVVEFENGADPRELAPRFVQLAEDHSKQSAACDALAWVVGKARNRPEAVRALELLVRDHLDRRELTATFPQVARAPSVAAEKLLRAAMDKSPHAAVRAQACLHLADLLDQQATVVEQLLGKPDAGPRLLQYYGREYGRHLQSLTRQSLDAAREKNYERMRQSFADVAARDSTMGEIAAKALFRIRHLSIDRVAPEIEHEDIAGEQFKLSDYRGKVVVLSFWGHW